MERRHFLKLAFGFAAGAAALAASAQAAPLMPQPLEGPLPVNPDAHRKDGLLDMHYGIFVARKGGVSSSDCLNSMNLQEITAYFEKLKFKIQKQEG